MLNQIVDSIRLHVAEQKKSCPLATLSYERGTFALSHALAATKWALIAECKLASPAKGTLCGTHTVPELAAIFTAQGATALSVHTSAPFRGKLADIAAVRQVSQLPILRKDFIIDEYQLYEARAGGADAILLIAAILTDAELTHFLSLASELGLDALVEVHSRPELERVRQTPANLVGINNRDLTTFQTSVENTFHLLPHCDPRWRLISESGIHNANDVRRLKAAGLQGILVGEGLVQTPDIAARTKEFAQPEIDTRRNEHA
jgi:indole-3-glycerol phosphate synthase